MFDQVLWFATRGAGAVSLLMFTASVALGLVTVARFQAAGWPRFFNYELHRRISLLSIVFLAIHILAAVFDPFTKLGLGAALVPLASSYRPVQVALGVIAMYLFVALIVTSLLRRRIGERAWRAVHWTSYAMWPLALAHGITAGTDATTTWMLAIDILSIAVVAGALWWRIAAGNPNRRRLAEVVAASSWNAARGDGR
jgi:sulfoxide reductase heme-binding subunit YedZ